MKILYTLSSRFPFGRAYASRALNLCRALRDAGHEIFVFCDYLSEEVLREQGVQAVFEGIKIYTTYLSLDGIRSLKRSLLIGRDAIDALDRALSEIRFDLILSSSTSDRFSGVYRLARKYGIPIVLEICEWFDVYSWTYGKWDPRHWQCQRCWRRYYPQVDGVIAISRLLETTFEKMGLPVIRIPTVLDIQTMDARLDAESDPVKLLFAGDISTGKDRLIEVIQAVSGKNYARPVTLDVYGPSVKEVAAQSDGAFSEAMLQELENVKIHGFRPQGEIHARCMESDLGLILRPNRRSSNAGFPTKLAEYLAAGTPVIANDTGDITMYLKDGYNGFVLKDIQPNTIMELLQKIAQLPTAELSVMRENARRTAEGAFDYRLYQDELNHFLLEVIETYQKNI